MNEKQTFLVELDYDIDVEVLEKFGFEQDADFTPVRMAEGTYVIRGWAVSSSIEIIQTIRGVKSISHDSEIDPFEKK